MSIVCNDDDNDFKHIPSTIFYRSTCSKCVFLSRIAWLIGWCLLKRVPIEAPLAQHFYNLYPGSHGKLLLVFNGNVTFGKLVFIKVLFIPVYRINLFILSRLPTLNILSGAKFRKRIKNLEMKLSR